MVITRIERQKKNPKRVAIFCDDEFTIGVHEDVLLKTGLRKGDVIDEQRLRELQSAEELNLARTKALRYLSRRQRSEKEIRTKLREDEFDPSVIESVIAHLKSIGYLNDREFAEAFVHDMLMKKPAGARLLRQQLRLKGVDKDTIEEVLGQQVTGDSETTLARDAARKHMRRYRVSTKKLERMKQQKRLADYLTRRGFAWETVSSVIREIFSNKD